MTAFSMKTNFSMFKTTQNQPTINKNKDVNNEQGPAKVRSKTVPETHLGAQKAYVHHWASDRVGAFCGPGAP